MERKLLTTTALAVLFSAWIMSGESAVAADMLVPQPDLVPVPAPVEPFSWNGSYLGLHLGWSWGKGHTGPEFSENGPVDLSLSGPMIGLSFGFNRQSSNGFVWGAEGDVFYTDYHGSKHFLIDGDNFDLRFKSDFQGSARLRAGVALDRTLIYTTAGLAVASGKLSVDNFSDRNTHIGWTAGVGVEHAFTDHWLGRVELRYSDYNKKSYDTPFGETKFGFDQTSVILGIGRKF